MIGIEPEFRWRFNMTVLQRGDVPLAYTDGLSEAMNFRDEDFGFERAEQALRTAVQAGYDADGIVKHVLWEMHHFTGLQTRADDLSMVAMRVL